ncbi:MULTISPECIES: nitronate monooxygenase family protein [unclassified Undibacterium]|uniref:NAD(P)H-dependent flavin oxidoreductase n=1 Tax=unclassified Undibacterium TaxID=2630295 RepID=UPI002AC9E127|nr:MULTISPECIES: nitronate monooxygenase family protein [unclassified Undibacterium]MEB0138912.1 nitronate monooxygenase family protein [Undibacterium sp. CCC2.1]MEB0171757.1 nitronate monooxygenase family protein [Undibacterium sp. CCC1.1]MEB0175543.1 nitronate monooxygenase family protein [Undibacterium sp. CCC3.4]MEB0214959.1 nitronate monooxygenase family protein [Undibacterium sp. 5I2]WPX44940.1 nitronate monooxygenase family protein [Undibacterium sp. CCC3.4]
MTLRLPPVLQNLTIPVIASPMFIASGPKLVAAQCKAGIVGSFPALNARPAELLDSWLSGLEQELASFAAEHPGARVGPIAVNQIVHQSNDRLAHDVEVCVRHRVPIIISSLRAPPQEMLAAIHSYGGIVLHDVISIRHAHKALEAGVDGLILVAAGAGGHAGGLSPFALVGEVRKFFAGPVALSGSIATGDAILAAQAMGADLAYIGSRWLATPEANVDEGYRQAILEATAADIVYTNLFTGVHGNYLRQSIIAAGLDPENLPLADKSKMDFGSGSGKPAKAWRDIWGAGQGVGLMDDAPTVAEIVARFAAEYARAKARLLSL